MASMNVLPTHKRILVLKCLVDGMSIRATTRITGVSKTTVLKLLVDAGTICAAHLDQEMHGLPCRRLQVDEIWSFVYAKKKNVPTAKTPPRNAGDVWTWIVLCADTKLIPCWRVGDRSAATAFDLMHDLRPRLFHRIQLTSDGLPMYLAAVEDSFGEEIDFAQLVKNYDRDGIGVGGISKTIIEGHPDPAAINTSFVERQNLTMRMSMRRFTRLTNAFSKKLENHSHAIALHIWHYNYCRIHQTIRVTPAMEAEVTDRLLELSDLVRMIDEEATPPGPRGPYRRGGNSS